MATVSGKLKGISDAEGDPNATVDITLCGYGSRVPSSRGMGGFVGSYYTAEMNSVKATLPGNAFTITLSGNDIIVPAGTYYTITFRNGNGDILQCNAYIFLDGNNYDIDFTDPFDPNIPPPSLPVPVGNNLLVVPFSNSPIFDGTTYTSWQITLNGDVTGAILTNIVPGNLYTFIVQQDGTGGHLFTWPSAISIQGFNCGGNAVTGTPWTADDLTWTAGSTGVLAMPIDKSHVTNPAPDAVYQSQRWCGCTFGTSLTGLTPNGSYKIRVHYCSIGTTIRGERYFTYFINNQQLWPEVHLVDQPPPSGDEGVAYCLEATVQADATGTITVQVQDRPVTDGGTQYSAIINGIELQAYGDALHNPTSVDRRPNAITIQTFVADENGQLYSIAPGTVSP